MATVFANGRSILHAGDGLQHIAAPPDVCKTPTPGGPVPIPYVNIAADSDLADGTTSVEIEGHPVALADSNLSRSMGDEPGTAGGIISSKNMGKLTWATHSSDVKFEGKGVVRFMDVTQHNGNSFNTAFMNIGAPANRGTGLAYSDELVKCEICEKGPSVHRILEHQAAHQMCAAIVEGLIKAYGGERTKGPEDTAKFGKRTRYMVGFMVARCGKMFATTSGYTPPIFYEVVNATVPGTTVLPGGKVTIQEMLAANTSETVNDAKKRLVLHRVLKTITKTKLRSDQNKNYKVPGECAAAALLARSEHKPVDMSEQFFRSTGDPYRGSYPVPTIENRGPVSWPTAAELREKYSDIGEPSCSTCQETLHLMMCPVRRC